MDPELEAEKKEKRRINWRKLGRGFLFILATAAALVLGYLAVYLWQYYFPSSFLTGPSPYENWQVYRSEAYLLGLRYPEDWEAVAVNDSWVVFRPRLEEGQERPPDYVLLKVSPKPKRAETACEQDQANCSFFANGIYGERIINPESEELFFSKDGDDFSLVWFKYEEAAEGEASFAPIFEEMGKSLRFVTPEPTDAQTP